MATAFGRQSQVFRPTQISGCALWLDASDPDGNGVAPANGASLSTWKDKSLNGFSGTAVNSPKYQINIQNKLPGIQFNGTSQYINFGNVVNLGTSQIFVFSVAQFTGDGSVIAKSSFRGNAARWFIIRSAVDGGLSFGADATGAGVVAAFSDSTTSTQLVGGIWDRTSLYIFQNGTQKATASLSSSSSLSNTDPLYVGAYPNDTGTGPQSGLYLNGYIFEILVYRASITDTQRQQIEGYLAWKWGLVANLPSTHPYKNTPLYQLPPLPLVPAPTRITQRNIFSPSQISGCSLWYDAADTSKLTRSGSSVTNWTSKGTNAITITNAANYPTYVSNAYNKLGTLRFTFATNQALSNGSVANSVVQTNTNHTIFLVHNPNTDNSTPFGFLDSTGTGTKRISVHSPEGSNIAYDIGGRLTYSYANQATYLNGNLRLETLYVSGGNRFYRRDGTQLATNGTISASFDTNQILYIGGADPSYANYKYGGDYCEIVWFNTDLTTTQIQQMEGYLAWKWGLVQYLPSSHPYKNTPLYALQPLPTQRIPLFSSQGKSYFIDNPLWFTFGIPTSNFSSTLPIQNNGSASYTNSILQLTPNTTSQAGSAFYTSQVRIVNFSTQFNLRFDSTNADGATFCIQPSSITSLGGSGGSLGYGGIANSVAIRFDSYNNAGGIFSTDVLTGGTIPGDLAGSGNLNTTFGLTAGTTWNFLVRVNYNGTTLSYTIQNFNNLNQSFTSNRTINIGTTIGSSNAFVGFTAGTGGATETCSIVSWNWSNSK
jgi:hypothetical protein